MISLILQIERERGLDVSDRVSRIETFLQKSLPKINRYEIT